MQGITSIGWYVPAYRLDRAAIGAALHIAAGRGARAVACYDEDATTMAVEAVRAIATDWERPSTIWMATTRPTYLERSNASVIASAFGLDDAGAYDVGASIRGAYAALAAAAAAGAPSVAVMSDLRFGRPGSVDDLSGADAAVAVAFGPNPIAEVLGTASVTDEVAERWRCEGDPGPQSWDARWGGDVYADLMRTALDQLRKRAGEDLAEVDHLIVTSPSPRASKQARLDVRAGRVVHDGANVFGAAGAAQLGLLLADTLAVAEPGQTILVVQAADGADALLLRTTDRVTGAVTSPFTATGGISVDYPTYLAWRGLLVREPAKRPPVEPPAPPAVFRNEAWKFSFTGSRCLQCSAVHLPPQRVCMQCNAVDRMEPVTVRNDKATVRTFTVDHIAASPSPPTVVGVLDFDGGGRYRCQLTDVSADEVAVGARMEMTFRVISVAPNGVRNYFWKARPAREEATS